jgi:hypothetical protein
MAVPLFVDGRITGMIAISDKSPGRQWQRNDVQMMVDFPPATQGQVIDGKLKIVSPL